MFSGSKIGSPVTSGVTRRQSRVYFVDCKGILTPIPRTWVQKSSLLLQNRGHAEVLKKDPFFREIRNAGTGPTAPECPPPPSPRERHRLALGDEDDCSSLSRALDTAIANFSMCQVSLHIPIHLMHQSIESPGGGAGKWPGDVGLILFSTPKCCPAGWGHN